MRQRHLRLGRWVVVFLSLCLATACIAMESSGPGEGTDNPLIGNLSPAHYDTARVTVGDRYYIDREYTVTSLGPGLSNRLWIRTANDDKSNAAASQISFTLNEEAVIVVGYDAGATSVPEWLADWTEAPADIDVTVPAPRSPLRLFFKNHASGAVSLGGNLAAGAAGAQSMYVVLSLRPSELKPASIALTPAGAVLDPGESLQLTASLRDPLGRAITTDAVEWTATGGAIDAQGRYTAGSTPGPFHATATSPAHGLTRSAVVTIRDPSSSDATPPVVSGGQPTGTLPEGTSEATMRVTTNEAATCKWGVSSTTSYADLANTFTTTGGTSHAVSLAGLVDGQSYTRHVRCQDVVGNANGSSYAISFSVAPTSDVTPPVVSAGAPSGTLPAGTREIEMRVTTDEGATCRWGTLASASYTELANTFTTTGGTTHTTMLTELVDGQAYTRYVRCRDAAGNANTASYPVSFNISNVPATITGVTFDWSSYRYLAPGSDNWPLTWCEDGHQYTSFGDGGGFGGDNSNGRVSLGFARLEGDYPSFSGINIWGGANAENPATFDGKVESMLCINGVLYALRSPGSDIGGWDHKEVVKSTNKGASWSVLSASRLVGDAQGAPGGPFYVQYGQNYQANSDGYVYIFSIRIADPDLWDVQKPGVTWLARAPVAAEAFVYPSNWEWVTGFSGSNPIWGPMSSRVPVLQDADGFMRGSAMYHPLIGRFLMVTNHTARNQGNIAIWEAPRPWGPWTLVMKESGWPKTGDVVPEFAFGNFSPKWLDSDGNCVFVWFRPDSWNSVRCRFQR